MYDTARPAHILLDTGSSLDMQFGSVVYPLPYLLPT